MLRLFVQIENNRVVRLIIHFDPTRVGGQRLQMLLGDGFFEVQVIHNPENGSSGDDSGHEDSIVASNQNSGGSSGDSGHEDSSVATNQIILMEEPSSSDYDQEIQHDDDSVPTDSGASGSQSLQVDNPSGSDDYEGNLQHPVLDDYQGSPQDSVPAPASPSTSESRKESDYQQSSVGPIPDTPEAGEELSVSDNQQSSVDPIPDTPEAGEELSVSDNQQSSEGPVQDTPETSEEHSISDKQQAPAGPVSGIPQTSPYETNLPSSLRNISGSDPPTLFKPISLEGFTPFQLEKMAIMSNRRKKILQGTKVSHSSINIPGTELSGEEKGINMAAEALLKLFRSLNLGDDNSKRKKQRKIDEDGSEKTGCDFENLFLLAEAAAALEGSSSGTANVFNAGDDDPGRSAVAAERGAPEGPSMENMDQQDVDNVRLLEGLLNHYDENNDFPPPSVSTSPSDYERAVGFLTSWKAKRGSPASLRHNEDFELCKKIWFSP